MVLGQPESGEAAMVHEAHLFTHLLDQGLPGVVFAYVVVGSAVESYVWHFLGGIGGITLTLALSLDGRGD